MCQHTKDLAEICVAIFQKGCDFWHWELEYVIYLLDSNVPRGDAGVDALGWAEEGREELKLRQEELVATSPGIEELMMQTVIALLKEAMFLLKVVVGIVSLVCVVVLLKK
jgi:hypothetical protein